jgi:hypothetical protein
MVACRFSAWRTRSSNGLRIALRPFSSAMIPLAFSGSFQNYGPFISCSSESRRNCLSPKSKRVSQMEDLVDHAFGRALQFGVQGSLLTRERWDKVGGTSGPS